MSVAWNVGERDYGNGLVRREAAAFGKGATAVPQHSQNSPRGPVSPSHTESVHRIQRQLYSETNKTSFTIGEFTNAPSCSGFAEHFPIMSQRITEPHNALQKLPARHSGV